MADPIRVTIVPRIPTSAKISLESGKKLYGVTTGQSVEINTTNGNYKIDAVSGRDLLNMGVSVGTSWSTSNPSNQAYSITLPKGGPFYMGWDTQRGLILGVRVEGGKAGIYADIGISIIDAPDGSNIYSSIDSDTYVTFSDGQTKLTNTLVGLPGGGARATYYDNNGKLQTSFQPQYNALGVSLGQTWSKCFLKQTPIMMASSTLKNIEDIVPGDLVFSFDPLHTKNDDLASNRVTRVFQNVSTQIIDLYGLFCTPGHVFLTSKLDETEERSFESISNILKNDGCVVRMDGTVVRARTNEIAGSLKDQLVTIQFLEPTENPENNCERLLLVRAGIPITKTNSNGEVNTYRNLSSYMLQSGIHQDKNGKLYDALGVQYSICDWPFGFTPFDSQEQENWIVEIDGRPYTPTWINNLLETDEDSSLRVIS